MRMIVGCFFLFVSLVFTRYSLATESLPPPPQSPSFPGGGIPDIVPQKRSPVSGAHLILVTHPPGALVNLGGIIIGETPLDQYVHAGSNIWLTVSKVGYFPQTMRALLKSGHTLSLDLPLSPVPAIHQDYIP